MDFTDIEKEIDNSIDEIINLRRSIHSYPELANNETETSKKILSYLECDNFIIERKAKTGIVALLEGSKKTKTILFRGDMDALPINEETDIPFASKIQNVMHSCGHDIHSSIVAGTAKVLSTFKKYMNGNIKFVFQPAEEDSPEGGMKRMINEGLLNNPNVNEAYALHVYNTPTGTIMFTPGIATCKSDRFSIEVFGKSSHAAMPNEGIDAIVVATSIVQSIQTIVSRNISINENAVISIGTINGGTRYNVVSDYVKIEGTIRTFSKDTANFIKNRLETISQNIAKAYGANVNFLHNDGYTFMYNDLDLSDFVSKSLRDRYGESFVIINKNPVAAAEDFSLISEKIPSILIWLGVESDFNNGLCKLHTPTFLPDENAIKIGIKVLCKIAYDKLFV